MASELASVAELPLETVNVKGVTEIAAVAGSAVIVTAPSLTGALKATVNVPLAETVICPTTVGIEPPLEAIAVGAPGKFVNPADSAIDDEAWPLKTT